MPVSPEKCVNILTFRSDVSNRLRGAGLTYFASIRTVRRVLLIVAQELPEAGQHEL